MFSSTVGVVFDQRLTHSVPGTLDKRGNFCSDVRQPTQPIRWVAAIGSHR